MKEIIEKLRREPVLIANAVTAVVALAVAFGVPVTPEQRAAIVGLVVVVGSIVARSKVTPV